MHTFPDLCSAAVTVGAVVVYFATALNVGRARVKYDIKAPATAGHPYFERAFRVQMNTLEQLAVFLPLLWLATAFFTPAPLIAAALGALWIVGRITYALGYLADPEKRGPGFGVAAVAQLGLLLLSLAGIVIGFTA